MDHRCDAPAVKLNSIAVTYDEDEDIKHSELSQSHESWCKPKGDPQRSQSGFTPPVYTIPQNFAGRKRTSSGSFKEPFIDEFSAAPAQSSLARHDPYDTGDPSEKPVVFDHELPAFEKDSEAMDIERSSFHKDPTEALEPERTAKPSKQLRKHKRNVSLLPWKNEGNFGSEIR